MANAFLSTITTLVISFLHLPGDEGCRYGVIDARGQTTVPLVYHSMDSLGKNRLLVTKEAGERPYVINYRNVKQRFALPEQYSIESCQEGILTIRGPEGVGIAKSSGGILIPPEHLMIRSLYKTGFLTWKDHHHILFSKTGRYLGSFPENVQASASDFAEGLFTVRFPYDLCPTPVDNLGYVRRNGDVAIGPTYYRAGQFVHGLAPVQIYHNQKYAGGYVDHHGAMVFGPWDGIQPPNREIRGSTYFRLPDKRCFELSRHGHLYPTQETEYLLHQGRRYGKNKFIVTRNQTLEIVDKRGKIEAILPPGAVGVHECPNHDLIPVAFGGGTQEMGAYAPMDSKWGYANKAGKMVIPPTYQFALPFKKGAAEVFVTNAAGETCIGKIDKGGNMIIPPIYVHLEKAGKDHYIVQTTVRNFEKQKWLAKESLELRSRERYFFDLLKQYDLIDMSRRSLYDLLGQPDSSRNGIDYFQLSNQPDSEAGVEFRFSHNRLTAWRSVRAKQASDWVDNNVVLDEWGSSPDTNILRTKDDTHRLSR